MPKGVAKVATIVRMLTGWRGEEVLSLKWADLGEGGVTTLERAKTGDRVAMLPTLAERFLRTLPECSEYVFPTSHGKTPHLTRNGLNQAWRREIVARSGLEGQAAMPGNSRKTFTSLGPGLGVDADMMRLLTGHKVQGSHGDYLRLIEDHRVHADRIAAELAARLNLVPEGAEARVVASWKMKARNATCSAVATETLACRSLRSGPCTECGSAASGRRPRLGHPARNVSPALARPRACRSFLRLSE